MLTKDEIKYFRENQSEMTPELLSVLREDGNKGKAQQLDILDMPRTSDGYYLDQYGTRVSFDGNKGLKETGVTFGLFDIHLDEIERCSEDIHYFKDNYVKIVTPSGIDFPQMREYQNDFLSTVSGDQEDIVQLMPRQCVHGSTVVKTSKGLKTIKGLFEEYRSTVSFSTKGNPLFQESWWALESLEVLTPDGFSKVDLIHKTIPLEELHIKLENGLSIKCQERHVFITKENEEIHQKDSLGVTLKTLKGLSKVTEVVRTNQRTVMYDISIRTHEELYYTNEILSHNSGKSVTTQIYLQWLYTFDKDKAIGIVQNRGSTAREFLDKTKQIIINLPIWIQTGTQVWNKLSIQSETGMKILTDVPTQDSFRGSSIHCIVVDECAFIRTNVWLEFQDSIFPSQSSLQWKKNIILSTQNGQNHFYDLVEGQRHGLNGFELIDVSWRDTPRFNKDGTVMRPEDFRDQIVKKHGEQHFQQNYSCLNGDSKVTIKHNNEIKTITLRELQDLYYENIN